MLYVFQMTFATIPIHFGIRDIYLLSVVATIFSVVIAMSYLDGSNFVHFLMRPACCHKSSTQPDVAASVRSGTEQPGKSDQ